MRISTKMIKSAVLPDEIRAANFNNWFQGSMVKTGPLPLVVFHGTDRCFDRFDVNRTAEGGLFFSTSVEHASGFGDSVLPVFLCLRNIFLVQHADLPEHHGAYGLSSYISHVKSLGYDGILIQGFHDAGYVADTYIALKGGSAIKSSKANSGLFSPDDPTFMDTLSDNGHGRRLDPFLTERSKNAAITQEALLKIKYAAPALTM